MTELVFVACLAATPGHCEEQSLSYIDVPPIVCAMRAPPQLARWAMEHPGWSVERWSCRIGGVAHDA
jgi:hypothetical protein